MQNWILHPNPCPCQKKKKKGFLLFEINIDFYSNWMFCQFFINLLLSLMLGYRLSTTDFKFPSMLLSPCLNIFGKDLNPFTLKYGLNSWIDWTIQLLVTQSSRKTSLPSFLRRHFEDINKKLWRAMIYVLQGDCI